MNKPGIVFMGTPRFAVPSLEILVENGYPVKAVVTATDKPSGRGLRINEPAVKTAAVARGIPVLQPVNLKDEAFAEKLRELSADIFVVVAFRVLPEKIWTIPPLGTVNLHASLLPLYRGAAPINHAIINGEKITGVTTFLIEKKVDTGRILMQEKTEIKDNDTAGSLHDRLMVTGAGLLLRTVDALAEGRIEPVAQEKISDEQDLPRAPKISKNSCRINWNMPAEGIYNFIRGLSPYPGAWTLLHSGNRITGLKIFEAEKTEDNPMTDPGKIAVLKDKLLVGTADGSICLKKVQAEGKKVIEASEFIKGYRLDPGAYCT